MNSASVSIFRRAEFYSQTKPTALNPDYQVTLTTNKVAPVTVNVPDAAAATAAISCGTLGGMEVSWWDHEIRTVLMPKLATLVYGSGSFPIFELSNVVEFITNASQCCVLGFHNAFTNPSDGGTQTYATAMYDNTHGAFVGSKDISALSHEIAEWADDPLVDGTNNNTKPWGNIGQVSGCQINPEVGDVSYRV